MSPKLFVAYALLSALQPDPKNPRTHSQRQISQIARSLAEFGFIVPILVDPSYRIIAGHGRYLAAKKLKITEVPIVVIDHLSEEQLRAYQIADNALNANSDWSQVQLGLNLLELSAANIDLLEITGLEVAAIDIAIESVNSTDSSAVDAADQNVETPQLRSISKLGDVWLAGPHRLMCGDARDLARVEQLMSGVSANAAFLDVPYNVRVRGHVSGKGAFSHEEFEMASGEMTSAEYRDFLLSVLGNVAGATIDGALHYVCSDSRHIADVLTVGDVVYNSHKTICVWVKSNAGMGSLYRSQHELIAVFKKGAAAHRNNIELGKHGRSRTNVWSYPGANSFTGRNTDEGNLLALHPTVKPVQLVADTIMDCTAHGDIVLDTFLGSGSTLIAAERVRRVCYGMDIDPRYVDVSVRRWQRHCGRQAIHAETGKLFDDTAEDENA